MSAASSGVFATSPSVPGFGVVQRNAGLESSSNKKSLAQPSEIVVGQESQGLIRSI